jgi:hypothetical protein
MYCGFPARNVFARSVINGGAITQLAITVTSSGFGLVAAFLMSLNRIPKTVGYIMKNRSMPIGIDSCLNFRESINCPNCGMNLPTNKPITMQIAIQRVRYFSKIPSVSLLAVSFDAVKGLSLRDQAKQGKTYSSI